MELLDLSLMAGDISFILLILCTCDILSSLHAVQVFYNTARYYHAYYGHKTVRLAYLDSNSNSIVNLIFQWNLESWWPSLIINYLTYAKWIGSTSSLGGASSGCFSFAVSESMVQVYAGTMRILALHIKKYKKYAICHVHFLLRKIDNIIYTIFH